MYKFIYYNLNKMLPFVDLAEYKEYFNNPWVESIDSPITDH